MTELSIIIPIIAVIIQGFIAIFIAWYGQKKTAKDIEELKHKLSEERFYEEKWWNEAKILYTNISRVCQELSKVMKDITQLLSVYKELYPFTQFYVLRESKKEEDNILLRSMFQNATEEEKREIRIFKKSNSADFWQLRDELYNMSGLISIFASERINKIYYDIIKHIYHFWPQIDYKLYTSMIESSNRTGSPAENEALDHLIEAKEYYERNNIREISDLKTFNLEFSKKLKQIHEQMRAELIKGRKEKI